MTFDFDPSTEIMVFTGPESSGKTTCAQRIAQLYQLPLVKEYAREYLKDNGPSYTFDDLLAITSKQIELETRAHLEHTLIVCDTDIITLEIWAMEKFGLTLKRKDHSINKKHYFLCYPDIPWEPDPLRENPNDRKRLFEIYQAYLVKVNATFTILTKDERKNLSLVL
ncbi:MAG: ATP-binding protein [Saprospiraceae bacterium]|nr:ATP-binding protein [Saprospiraceae bacterium]